MGESIVNGEGRLMVVKKTVEKYHRRKIFTELKFEKRSKARGYKQDGNFL